MGLKSQWKNKATEVVRDKVKNHFKVLGMKGIQRMTQKTETREKK